MERGIDESGGVVQQRGWSAAGGPLDNTAISKTELLPATISRRTGRPELASGEDVARIHREYADLHACTGLAASPVS